MLRARVIPVLLIRDRGLVKTVKFTDEKYVGDPLNAVKIFNEKRADEIVVLDIDATAQGREPDYKMLENLAAECRMPLCYGGGVNKVEQVTRILSLGIEKIALGAAAVQNPALVEEAASICGSQSIAAVLDVKARAFSRGHHCYTHNAKKNTKINPVDYAPRLEELGVGELIVNSIDKDGTMEGYDLSLIAAIREKLSIPVTALGGAGSMDDIEALIEQEKIIGAAAGSTFVFKGKYRAVLINYPKRQ